MHGTRRSKRTSEPQRRTCDVAAKVTKWQVWIIGCRLHSDRGLTAIFAIDPGAASGRRYLRPTQHGTSLIPLGAVPRSFVDRSLPDGQRLPWKIGPSVLEVEKPGLCERLGRGRLACRREAQLFARINNGRPGTCTPNVSR